MGRIAVHARSGNIELAVPPAAHFALNANTEHGEIDNQFGDGLKESEDGKGARLEGSVGSGPDVNLVTQHGSITVKKSTGESSVVKLWGRGRYLIGGFVNSALPMGYSEVRDEKEADQRANHFATDFGDGEEVD